MNWICPFAFALLTPLALAADEPQDRHHQAMARYEIGHYSEAFDLFAQLADQGHCDAMRIARQMVQYGRRLYGTDFPVEPRRLQRWTQATGCSATVTVAR